MPRKFFLALILILVLLSACNSGEVSDTFTDGEAIEIKIGMLPFASYAPLFIAEVEGFYAEQGLT